MLEVLKAIVNCLSQAQIQYMIVGGQAVTQYGEPRFTQDIDITISKTPDDLKEVVDAIREDFTSLPEDQEGFVRDTWVLPVEHSSTRIRVDIIFSISPFEREAIQNAREITMEGFLARFISPEDLVIQKIIAGRARDLDDAQNILEHQEREINLNIIEKKIESLAREVGEEDWWERWISIRDGLS